MSHYVNSLAFSEDYNNRDINRGEEWRVKWVEDLKRRSKEKVGLKRRAYEEWR